MGRAYRFWTPREDQRLRDLRGAQVSFTDCARVLGRAVTSVKARAFRVGAVAKRSACQVECRRNAVAQMHAGGLTILEMYAALADCGGCRAQLARDHKALGLIPHRKTVATWARTASTH